MQQDRSQPPSYHQSGIKKRRAHQSEVEWSCTESFGVRGNPSTHGILRSDIEKEKRCEQRERCASPVDWRGARGTLRASHVRFDNMRWHNRNAQAHEEEDCGETDQQKRQ